MAELSWFQTIAVLLDVILAYFWGGREKKPVNNKMAEVVPSWFNSMNEFCTKVGTVFVQVTACLRLPDENMDERACLSAYQRNMCLENRDSMGLLAAIFTGREVKARELMALPWTNINAQYANGNTPLILAVQGNNDMLVSLLLDHPSLSVNLRGLDGYTALIRAAGDRADYVAMLLSHTDINPNLATYFGTTALTYAIRCGNEEAARLLLDRSEIDVNFQSRHGENALIEAVTYRRYEIAKTLVNRRDCLVDIVDERDRTPLIMAAQYGYTPLVRLLLHCGCDPSAEDDTGHNALHYALKRGSQEMVEEIIDAISEPLSLARICRTVIRRHLRYNWGYGEKLKPIIDKIPKYELPKTLKRFIAYEP